MLTWLAIGTLHNQQKERVDIIWVAEAADLCVGIKMQRDVNLLNQHDEV
jgi:hypothetical protein